MKLRFTNVTVKDVSDQIVGMPMTVLMGTSASYEARDSDGFGNVGIDSGGIAPSDSYQPMYSSIAQVEALTQQQIYDDFYPTETITIVVDYELDLENETINQITEEESVGEQWLASIKENLELQISIDKESKTPTIENADNITDQTPINL